MDNSARIATIERHTMETRIVLQLELDGTGCAELSTGVPFFEHMLSQVARHGLMDIHLKARGDVEIDAHHLVEDVGIVFGQAFHQVLGNKAGLRRYAHAYVPLDEALSRVVIDCSGRPGLYYNVSWPRARIGEFDVDLMREFFQGFVNHAMVTLHIDNLRGQNAHHMAETLFKAFGRAIHDATRIVLPLSAIPSTKGLL